MYAEIASGLAGIKTVSDLVTLTLKLKVDSAVTEKALESQSAIIALQSAVLAIQMQNQELLEENKQLKQQLIDAEKWDEEAQKYTLAKVGGYDSLAYVLKPEYEGTAPEHWLCIYCYEEKRKSMLQRTGSKEGRALFTCGRCSSEIMD